MSLVAEIAGPADADALAGLIYQSHTVSFAPFASPEWVASRDLETYRKQWHEFFERSQDDARSQAWKVVADDRVVGMVKISPLSNGEAQLASMHVHPDYHRRGIGTLLMNAAMAFVSEAGYKTASLGVIQANAPARGIYERFGWTVRELRDNGIEGVPIALYEIEVRLSR